MLTALYHFNMLTTEGPLLSVTTVSLLSTLTVQVSSPFSFLNASDESINKQ